MYSSANPRRASCQLQAKDNALSSGKACPGTDRLGMTLTGSNRMNKTNSVAVCSGTVNRMLIQRWSVLSKLVKSTFVFHGKDNNGSINKFTYGLPLLGVTSA